jgi:hypothetical protein
MKLRFLNKTMRLRLRRSELERLVQGEVLINHVPLLPQPLSYSLRSDPDQLAVSFDAGELTVVLLDSQVEQLLSDQQIGLYLNFDDLAVTIEKDFQRTHVRTDEDSDLYPNPRKKGGLTEIIS